EGRRGMGSKVSGTRAVTRRFWIGRRMMTAAVAVVPLLAAILGSGGPIEAYADSLPWVSVNDVTMPRPTTGTAAFAFTITLAHPSNATVYVNYTTADGSARSTFDYVPISGTATFTPGKTTQ